MISSKWFEHNLNSKNSEAKKEREELVKSSTILDTLDAILQSEQRTLIDTPMSDFDNPNWSLRQAARQGQMSLLKKLRTLTIRN